MVIFPFFWSHIQKMVIDKTDIAECLLHHLFLAFCRIDAVFETFCDLDSIIHIIFIEHMEQQSKWKKMFPPFLYPTDKSVGLETTEDYNKYR